MQIKSLRLSHKGFRKMGSLLAFASYSMFIWIKYFNSD